jgi:hypothetical protein
MSTAGRRRRRNFVMGEKGTPEIQLPDHLFRSGFQRDAAFCDG